MTMQQKIPQPEFGEDESAPFKNDLLGREREIKSLTPMITTIASPAVMAIDAEWGAGKTAFIKMWKAHLNKETNASALYFNAWETDFAADPFMPFVNAVAEKLPQNKREKLKESAKAFFPIVVGDLVRKFVGSGSAKIAEEMAESWFNHRDKTKEFKGALESFAKTKTAEGVEVEKRIVIFVDELDRCRPDYAIKVLERIKHLFEVPGVVFVLAINRAQLRDSVKSLYGMNDDNAETYLRRFIEFDYTIKAPEKRNIDAFIAQRLASLRVRKFLGESRDAHEKCNELREMLVLFARVYDLPLRDVEQLLMRVVLALYTLEKDAEGEYRINMTLLGFMVMMRLQMRKDYNKYINSANWQEVVNRWESDLIAAVVRWPDINERAQWITDAAFVTTNVIMTGYPPSENSGALDVISRYKKKAETASNAVREYYIEVARFVEKFTLNSSRGINLQFFIRKVEMLDQFRLSDDAAKGNGN